MRKMLLIAGTDINSDPRVKKQFDLFKQSFDLYVLAGGAPESGRVTSYLWKKKKSGRPLLVRLAYALALLLRVHRVTQGFFSYTQNDLDPSVLQLRDIEYVYANDLETLPVAVFLAEKFSCKLIYDAHEYSPLQKNDSLLWRILIKPYVNNVLRKSLPKLDLMISVCQGIGEKYLQEFGVASIVVPNVTVQHDLPVRDLHDPKIRIIHHGNSSRSRRLEEMIFMMDHVDDRYHLDLMLVPTDKSYWNELCELAQFRANVDVIPPVELNDIVLTLNRNYDVGIFLLPPENFNLEHALPNKFFEFIQARLAVAIGPSKEMVPYVDKYKNGIIADSFDSKNLALKLNSLDSEQLKIMKQGSDTAAGQLCFEKYSGLLLDSISDLTSKRG